MNTCVDESIPFIGIDDSPEMLGRCREKAGDTLLIRRERTPLFEGLPVEEQVLRCARALVDAPTNPRARPGRARRPRASVIAASSERRDADD